MQKSQNTVLSDSSNKVCQGLRVQLSVFFGPEYVC